MDTISTKYEHNCKDRKALLHRLKGKIAKRERLYCKDRKERIAKIERKDYVDIRIKKSGHTIAIGMSA